MGHMTLTDYLAGLPPPFDTHGGYDGATLSKLIRSELAGAVVAGVFPAGTKFSVRLDDHHSYSVGIEEWPGAVFTSHYSEWRMERELDPASKNAHGYITAEYIAPDQATRSSLVWRDHGWQSVYDVRCTDVLNAAVKAADTIADRHNYNNSDSQADHFDVGYYLNVGARTVIATAEHGIAMESDPSMQDLARRAALAATALGAACVKSYCGRRGIDGASADTMGKLIKLADRANGRPVTYDKRRRSWVVGADERAAAIGAQVEALVNGPTISERDITRYFRCFARDGRNLGDTPYVMRDGRAVAADGSYGLIEHVGNETSIEIEARIMDAINAGKRGGRVATINWSLV